MRGEWIEILGLRGPDFGFLSLPMRGEWIEIRSRWWTAADAAGLSPCGESGLKFSNSCDCQMYFVSLPMRGEWIEIFKQ